MHAAGLLTHVLTAPTDKSTITFAEYMAVMEKSTLHEDPTVALKDAFAIFDRCMDPGRPDGVSSCSSAPAATALE